MRAVLAIAWKDVRLLRRDNASAFFTFFFPMVYALLFGTVMNSFGSGMGAMDIVVVDLDNTEGSAAFTEALANSNELDVLTLDADSGEEDARADARDLVRRRKRVASVVIPAGFGERVARPFVSGPMELEIALDPSRQAEGAMLQGLLMRRAFEQFQGVMRDSETLSAMAQEGLDSIRKETDEEKRRRLAPLEAFLGSLDTLITAMQEMRAEQSDDPRVRITSGEWMEPVKFTTTEITAEKANAYAITFPQGIVWGAMSASLAMALSLVVERRTGTLLRMQVAPLSRSTLLMGKALASGIISLLVLVVLIAMATLFGVRPSSAPLLILACGCTVVGFVGVMMLLSVCGKTEAAVNGIGWSTMLMLAMVGGAMMPRAFMPGWLQSLGMISPIGWSITALEGALWRDYSLAEMIGPCGALVAIGVVGFVVGVRVFDWSAARE
ncbi:MAG: ABC transporter permease [Phycisphaeraceae bacterium]|nr:ABC transporter permease [Phycisphaeraceae bacterium]